MSTCVVYKPSKCYPPQTATAELWFDTIALKAGPKNFLDDQQLQALVDHPDYPRYRAWDAIEIMAPETPAPELPAIDGKTTYPSNLSGLSVDKAEHIVNACDDLIVLRTWFDAETRKTLREILTRRISEIVE